MLRKNPCQSEDTKNNMGKLRSIFSGRKARNRGSMLLRRIAAGLMAAALVLPLAGCGENGEAVVTEQKGKTKISFSWWGNDPRHQYTLKGLEVFEEKNPDIKVSHSYGIWDGYERRYQIMMLSHSQADVMQVNYGWLKKYSPHGNGYYDLNKLSDLIDLRSYSEEDLATGTIGSSLLALPIAYNTTVLFYNKDIFDEYGLEIPQTWEDLIEAGKVMGEDGIYPVGMIGKHLFLLLVARYEQLSGGKLFDEEGVYVGDEEDTRQLLEEYKELVDAKVLPPANEYDDSAFTNRKLAGVACWVSDSSRYCNSLIEEGANIVLGDRLHSENEKCSGWYMKPATMYTISRDAENPEAAAILLNFLVNDPDMAKLQGTEKGVPVSSQALEALQEADMINSIEYDASKMIRDNQDELDMMIPILEDSNIQKAFIEASDKYLYDIKDLDAAANEMSRKFRKLAPEKD